jgi:hypothetical protein
MSTCVIEQEEIHECIGFASFRIVHQYCGSSEATKYVLRVVRRSDETATVYVWRDGRFESESLNVPSFADFCQNVCTALFDELMIRDL